MNVRIPTENINTDSFMVQWDAVTDIFPITYTVRWYGENTDNSTTTNELSYTITGLTSNTSYNVTVVANNTCCGAGPVSDVVMAATMSDNIMSSTMPTPSVIPPSNSMFLLLCCTLNSSTVICCSYCTVQPLFQRGTFKSINDYFKVILSSGIKSYVCG